MLQYMRRLNLETITENINCRALIISKFSPYVCTATFSLNWGDSSNLIAHTTAIAPRSKPIHTTSTRPQRQRQRQGKQVNYTQDNSFFPRKRRRVALGGIRTHGGTLQSRRALYLLSYQGNSVGRSRNLQHNAKGNYTIPPSHTRQTKSTIPPSPQYNYTNI